MSKSNVLNNKHTIRDAILILEKKLSLIIPVLDDNDILIGIITDGDIRRSILKGYDISSNVCRIMNKNPIVVKDSDKYETKISILKNNSKKAAPVLDIRGKFVEIFQPLSNVMENTSKEFILNNLSGAFIMAGGEGKRLRPITYKTPKPLININGQPVLKLILKDLENYGVNKVFISVNYLKEKIIEHLKDKTYKNISFEIIKERKKLGTAGSLNFISSSVTDNILVLNGDIYTNCNYEKLLDYHIENKADITISVIEHYVKIPFGVFEMKDDKPVGIIEKPSKRFFSNAGIYIISNKLLNYIPQNKFYDMTDLIEKAINSKKNVSLFPLFEEWHDIGTKTQLREINKKFLKKTDYTL